MHTPGPWSINNNIIDNIGDAVRIDGPDGLPVASILKLYAHREDKTDAFYEAHANSALIAAAPDMLSALQAIMAEVAGVQKDTKYEAARAAIARATGG
jgi:hypothetical protein